MACKHTSLCLPGDGIGPEVVAAGRAVLEAVAKKAGHEFTFKEYLIGGCAIDTEGTPLGKQRCAPARLYTLFYSGRSGGPNGMTECFDAPGTRTTGAAKGLAAFANLRPVKTYPGPGGGLAA